MASSDAARKAWETRRRLAAERASIERVESAAGSREYNRQIAVKAPEAFKQSIDRPAQLNKSELAPLQ